VRSGGGYTRKGGAARAFAVAVVAVAAWTAAPGRVARAATSGTTANQANGADATVAGATQARRFALVIGNNQPEATSGAATLRYADDDALSTHALLLEAGVDSVLLARLDADTRRMHPEVAPAGPPRAQAFDRAVDELFARMRAAVARGDHTELLVFYSGHGDVAAGEGYVVLEDRRVTRGDLHDLLARSPAARNHVFVDACKSYFMAFEKGPGGQRATYGGSLLDLQPGHMDNVGFVLSTSSDRDSHEWEQYQGGILSHELRSALRGGADADGDGRVTYAELGAFLSSANEGIVNPRFRPDFLVRPPGRNARSEVLRWPGALSTSTIRLNLHADAHVYVEDTRGERIADAHPAATQSLTLRVPVERPLFVRRNDETAEAVVSTPGQTLVAALEPRRVVIEQRGALSLAFRQLFSVPFDAHAVDAFVLRRFDEPAAPPAAPRAWGRAVAGGVTAGAALAGLTLNAIALQRYWSAGGGSQQQIDAANHTVHRLNVASAICYGAAAAAGATWAWLVWGADVSPDRGEVTVTVGASF